ncbi:hypothetical protein FQA39_LY08861 [Lamprigera yunnana]|nr:hypothetical protein FQA39_LY08861 [Lamprigera yunnana]
MSSKRHHICLKCGISESPMWTNAESLGVICLNCINETKDLIKTELEEDDKDNLESRKKGSTTKSYKTRLNPLALPKVAVPKAKGRRTLFKRSPKKAPTAVATPVTSDCVFYEGSYFQIGDIVSMIDQDGDTYYAQIRGFLTDQYCEKSACVTWLLPTKHSPPPEEAFDPVTYIMGPEEDTPRELQCMEFIMHAPSDYYHSKNTPYPPIHSATESGYVWTTLDPIQRSQSSTS